MSIFNFFKKKEDPFAALMKESEAEKGTNIDLPELDDFPSTQEQKKEDRYSGPDFPQFQPPQSPTNPMSQGQPFQPQTPMHQGMVGQRDIELILSKLDAIRAILTSMDQRITHLEKIAAGEEEQHPKW